MPGNVQIVKSFPVGATALAVGVFVKMATNLLVVATDAADDVIGVTVASAAANATTSQICVFGVCSVQAFDTAVKAGEMLECGAAGAADTYAGASADTIQGLALEDSSADGLIEILFHAAVGMGAAA